MVELIKLPRLTVLIENLPNEGATAEKLRALLQRAGIDTVGPEKYSDLARVRRRNVENPSYLLNEMRADRLNAIVSAVFNKVPP